MIVAGIDEAGYGPLLGPLVVGCCAFETPAQTHEPPCLWTTLRRVLSKSRDKKGLKIQINDSKLVYTPSAGLKELERGVLGLVGSLGVSPLNLRELLAVVAAHVLEDLKHYRWYALFEAEKFPIEQDATSIRLLVNGLKDEMQRCQTRCVHLSARVVLEGQLNRMLDQTRNKSSVLFSTAAIHLDYLLRNYEHAGLIIYCDRQGGREHYGRLLRLMFEEWSLQVVAEGEGHSEYTLSRSGHITRLIFREKAETHCLPVAAASMLCKYLREALMRRFNAWWSTLLPGLPPTAGYYTDGMRFLNDIRDKRSELGITEQELVRSR